MTDTQKAWTYRDAGVDIEAGNEFVERIKPMVKSTFRPEVLTNIGGFGGLFSFHAEKYQQPTLVAATDGVGTKLKVAFMADKHDTVGQDLVAMCVNDILVQGAEPLFFLDYFATGRLAPEPASQVVKGIAQGCKEAGCALIGGETAEMPGFYSAGEYDLAGFAVGAVDNTAIIDGTSITKGDVILGVSSSGLHANGYSLARKVFFEQHNYQVDTQLDDLSQPLGLELLQPTRIYARTIRNLLRDFTLKGMAHITGGGIIENVPRILPRHCQAVIHTHSWQRPAIFDVLQRLGNIAPAEMLRTFNNGLGLVLIVPQNQADELLLRLKGLQEQAWIIGEIRRKVNDDAPLITQEDSAV